jgi:hypothetical protein
MAWFDYLSAVGGGLGQGVQQFQRQQQLTAENARQQRALALQEAANRRAEEEAAAAEFERLMGQIEPGAELTPEVLAELTNPRFAQYAKAGAVKTPEGKLVRRQTQAQQKAALELETAGMQRDEAQRQADARKRIRDAGKGIYDLPMDERLLLATEAGYDPERLLRQAERVSLAKQLAQVSPSVLSAGIMANVRTEGAQLSPQEAQVAAQRAVEGEIRLNPALQIQITQDPALFARLVNEKAAQLLQGGAATPSGATGGNILTTPSGKTYSVQD